MERDARTVSSHQPAGAVKNRPLGTQAAPVCEGGVLAPVRLMTADRSRSLFRLMAEATTLKLPIVPSAFRRQEMLRSSIDT